MTTKDTFLASLARQYEQGKTNRVIDLNSFVTQTGSDYEEVERIAADLKSEGSIVELLKHGYRMTNDGYSKYKPRVDALSALDAI